MLFFFRQQGIDRPHFCCSINLGGHRSCDLPRPIQKHVSPPRRNSTDPNKTLLEHLNRCSPPQSSNLCFYKDVNIPLINWSYLTTLKTLRGYRQNHKSQLRLNHHELLSETQFLPAFGNIWTSTTQTVFDWELKPPMNPLINSTHFLLANKQSTARSLSEHS